VLRCSCRGRHGENTTVARSVCQGAVTGGCRLSSLHNFRSWLFVVGQAADKIRTGRWFCG